MKFVRLALATSIAAFAVSAYAGAGCTGCTGGSKDAPKEEKKVETPAK